MAKRKKSTKKRKQTKSEQIASIPIEQLTRLKGEEGKKQLISYVRTLRMGYTRRVQSFERRGIFSYAQYTFEATAPENPRKDLKKLTRNQLISELARYQKFFRDKTSSIEGIREVNFAQDIRIFGEGPNGEPNFRMNEDERAEYWSLYDEYKKIYKTGTFKYSSESVQQMLASVYFDPDDFLVNPFADEFNEYAGRPRTTMSILRETERRLREQEEEENMGAGPNVYSGRGPNRPR